MLTLHVSHRRTGDVFRLTTPVEIAQAVRSAAKHAGITPEAAMERLKQGGAVTTCHNVYRLVVELEPAPSAGDWPKDAVMIVAPLASERIDEPGRVAVEACCRGCRVVLQPAASTIATAAAMPERQGRPIRFFCEGCSARHRLPPTAIIRAEQPSS